MPAPLDWPDFAPENVRPVIVTSGALVAVPTINRPLPTLIFGLEPGIGTTSTSPPLPAMVSAWPIFTSFVGYVPAAIWIVSPALDAATAAAMVG